MRSKTVYLIFILNLASCSLIAMYEENIPGTVSTQRFESSLIHKSRSEATESIKSKLPITRTINHTIIHQYGQRSGSVIMLHRARLRPSQKQLTWQSNAQENMPQNNAQSSKIASHHAIKESDPKNLEVMFAAELSRPKKSKKTNKKKSNLEIMAIITESHNDNDSDDKIESKKNKILVPKKCVFCTRKSISRNKPYRQQK